MVWAPMRLLKIIGLQIYFFKGWFAQDNQNSSIHNLITFNNFIGTQFIHVPKSSKAKKNNEGHTGSFKS